MVTLLISQSLETISHHGIHDFTSVVSQTNAWQQRALRGSQQQGVYRHVMLVWYPAFIPTCLELLHVNTFEQQGMDGYKNSFIFVIPFEMSTYNGGCVQTFKCKHFGSCSQKQFNTSEFISSIQPGHRFRSMFSLWSSICK